jgi:putative intracellular protease/amidase
MPIPPAIHVVVFEGWADWEPGFALAEARRSGGIPIRVVGFSADPAASIGGLRVIPDVTLQQVRPEEVRLLLLPGGDLWEDPRAYPRSTFEPLLQRLVAAGVPVAGICGATLALARAGLLNDRAHTSNAADYLSTHAKEYRGAARYRDALAVRDRGVITASGAAPVEFAREVFEELGVFSPSDRAVWFHLFKTGRFPQPAG